MRDMDRLNAKGFDFIDKHPSADLHTAEIEQLMQMSLNAVTEQSSDDEIPLELLLYNTIINSYFAGLAAGSQYEKGRSYRARKKRRSAAV